MGNVAGGIVKADKAKTKIIELNKIMSHLESEMLFLSNDVKTMIKGNEDGPYWNGAKAVKFYKNAKKNYDNNVVDFAKSVKNLHEVAYRTEETLRHG